MKSYEEVYNISNIFNKLFVDLILSGQTPLNVLLGFTYSLKRIFKFLEVTDVLSIDQINMINEKLDKSIKEDSGLIKSVENININNLNNIKESLINGGEQDG